VNLAQKIRENPRQSFVYALAVCYAAGFSLHVLDIFDLRLSFSSMDSLWKRWTLYLLFADLLTAILLIKKQSWGIVCFQIVALSQLIAYWHYQYIFGRQDFLVVFHVLTLAIYWKIYAKEKSRLYKDK
jgi:hypothetical protein